MGPFGASHYSLSFFIPLHPKLPSSDDGVHPEAVSVGDAWKGLGLTYFLLKGLKKTSKTVKLIRDSAEGHSKKDVAGTGSGGTSTIDKGASRSLSVRNPVSSRPVTSQNTAGYGLRKISRNKGQVSSHSKACKNDTLGVCKGEQKSPLADAPEDFPESALYEAATRSSADLRVLTERSLREFGLGIEGVMTTITGLSQQVHNKNEVKEIITVVKRADRVVQGVKAANGFLQTFSSPLGDALLALGGGGNGVVLGMNTVKIVLKGVKISKGFITVTKLCKNNQTGTIGVGAEMAIKSNQNMLGQRFKVIVKGLKASEGAANVVSISKEVGKTLSMLDKAELFSWGLIMKGFKFTKSALRVLEPVGSLHGGMMSAIGQGVLEMKGAVEGIGVVVKAVVLSQELYMVLLKVGGFTMGAMAAFNEFKRRSLLAKRLPGQPSDASTGGSGEDYSKRTEVSFKDSCHGQLAMPAIIWSLTEAESKCLGNELEFFEYYRPTKEAGSYTRTLDLVRDGEPRHQTTATWDERE
jgi:hypothetical protein